jgi:hypothetical protein
MNLKKFVFDGITIEVTDAGEQAILKLQDSLKAANTAKDTAEGALSAAKAAHTTALEAKDGEIAGLKAQIPDASAMDAAITARGTLISDAKKLGGDKLVTDGKSSAEIRRSAVALKLGDAAVKDRSDDYVLAAFDALVTSAGGDRTNKDPLRDALADSIPVGDVKEKAEAARAKHLEDTRNAYKTPASA